MPADDAASRDRPGVVGVLLAGGQARRLGGGDKCLLPLGERTILDAVVVRARPQVTCLVLNANGESTRFRSFGLPVVADVIEGSAGPLAGILTGLEWAQANAPACPWVASFATDTPFLPHDFVARALTALAAGGAEIACAVSRGRAHPVFGLWPVRLAPALHQAVAIEGVRKIDVWTARYRPARVAFEAEPVDPFLNINDADDLLEARRLHAAMQKCGGRQ